MTLAAERADLPAPGCSAIRRPARKKAGKTHASPPSEAFSNSRRDIPCPVPHASREKHHFRLGYEKSGLDVEKVADVAHSSGLPLLVDSTLTTPYLIRPFEHGADLIVHSATEFLSGYGIVVGGLLVDGGLFDWEAGHRHPTLTKSYEGFHGLVFAEEFGPLAFLTRAREEGIRDFGACMAPTTAFYILQGLETLSIRMEKHVANTRKILDFLVGHDSVLSVTYPELDSHPDFELAKRLLPWGAGSILGLHIIRCPISRAKVHRSDETIFTPS